MLRVLTDVEWLTLLFPRTFTLPEQDPAIPSSSQKQLPAELKAETQKAAQTGKSHHDEKLRQCCGCPASSQLHQSSCFWNTCSQHCGPPLPKEQLRSSWKVQARASPPSLKLLPPAPSHENAAAPALVHFPCDCHCRHSLPSQCIILVLMKPLCLFLKCTV